MKNGYALLAILTICFGGLTATTLFLPTSRATNLYEGGPSEPNTTFVTYDMNIADAQVNGTTRCTKRPRECTQYVVMIGSCRQHFTAPDGKLRQVKLKNGQTHQISDTDIDNCKHIKDLNIANFIVAFAVFFSLPLSAFVEYHFKMPTFLIVSILSVIAATAILGMTSRIVYRVRSDDSDMLEKLYGHEVYKTGSTDMELFNGDQEMSALVFQFIFSLVPIIGFVVLAIGSMKGTGSLTFKNAFSFEGSMGYSSVEYAMSHM